MKTIITVLAFITALLSGCATPQLPLSKQVQEKLDGADVVLLIPQDNLAITVQSTYTGNTGLIGALVGIAIDSARQSKAEKAAQPLIETLQDYDFRAIMLSATSEALAKVNKFRINQPIKVEPIDSDSAKRIAFESSTANAIIFSKVSYQLQAGKLGVTAFVEIYPKSENLKAFIKTPDASNPLDQTNAIYRRSFTYSKTGSNATSIKKDMNAAAESLAKQLANDLNLGI